MCEARASEQSKLQYEKIINHGFKTICERRENKKQSVQQKSNEGTYIHSLGIRYVLQQQFYIKFRNQFRAVLRTLRRRTREAG